MRYRLALAIIIATGSLSGALAQTRPPAKPNPPAAAAPSAPPAATDAAPVTGPENQTSTATYGDWTLRCTQGGTPPRRICEVVQNVVARGQTTPFAQIAFGRVEAKDPLSVTVVVPNNVSFTAPVRIAQEGAETPAVSLPWTRCLPSGCFASATANDDALKRWRAAEKAGRVTFVNGGGQEVAMIIPLRGLSQAIDALAKETRSQ